MNDEDDSIKEGIKWLISILLNIHFWTGMFIGSMGMVFMIKTFGGIC